MRRARAARDAAAASQAYFLHGGSGWRSRHHRHCGMVRTYLAVFGYRHRLIRAWLIQAGRRWEIRRASMCPCPVQWVPFRPRKEIGSLVRIHAGIPARRFLMARPMMVSVPTRLVPLSPHSRFVLRSPPRLRQRAPPSP